MQALGYIVIDDEIIRVLVRQRKYDRAIRIRQSGKKEAYFPDEEYFLQERPEIVLRLKNNETVNL